MLFIGADHRGLLLKEEIKQFLTRKHVAFEDCGAHSLDLQDDFTDYAVAVARKVSESPADHRGIVMCGSGVGVDIVANRFPEVRCALSWEFAIVKQSREHEDINMVAIPAEHIAGSEAIAVVEAFLHTPFSKKEKYIRRIGEINELSQSK